MNIYEHFFHKENDWKDLDFFLRNSPYTVLGDSKSAGRMYDLMKKKSKGKVLLVTAKGALCELKED